MGVRECISLPAFRKGNHMDIKAVRTTFQMIILKQDEDALQLRQPHKLYAKVVTQNSWVTLKDGVMAALASVL